MAAGLLSLALLGWAAADRPSPPALSPICTSARPDSQDPVGAIRGRSRGAPVDRRGRKVRDYLDDDDSDDQTSSHRHAGPAALQNVPATASRLVRVQLAEAAHAGRPAVVPRIYTYCTLLL